MTSTIQFALCAPSRPGLGWRWERLRRCAIVRYIGRLYIHVPARTTMHYSWPVRPRFTGSAEPREQEGVRRWLSVLRASWFPRAVCMQRWIAVSLQRTVNRLSWLMKMLACLPWRTFTIMRTGRQKDCCRLSWSKAWQYHWNYQCVTSSGIRNNSRFQIYFVYKKLYEDI